MEKVSDTVRLNETAKEYVGAIKARLEDNDPKIVLSTSATVTLALKTLYEEFDRDHEQAVKLVGHAILHGDV